MGWLKGRELMVVENPVTFVLYGQFPFIKPYLTLNVSIPAYGPQLIKILVGLNLFESIISGTVVIVGAMQGAPPPVEEEEEELELEEEDEPAEDVGVGVEVGVGAHEELLTVVLLNVIAAVCAITLPSSIAPPPGKVTDSEAKTVPAIVVVPLNVAEEATFQNT